LCRVSEDKSMAKRLVRKLTEVANEVKTQILSQYDVSTKDLGLWQERAKLKNVFPQSSMQAIDDLWIDYEVQRDVLYKHIINIMKKWDGRICSPVSACRLSNSDRIETYDGQHRTISAAILGFTEVPCAVVVTDDKNFASYAFEMLNDTGVKRLTPGDLHRNALVRYKNGSREARNVRAHTMQIQFDNCGIDLQDKSSRNSASLCGDNEYYFSHFKYAQKVIDLDPTGKILFNILESIRDTFQKQDEIDQGIFIGLYELQRLKGTQHGSIDEYPSDWMKQVLAGVKKSFKSSHVAHNKAKIQWEHSHPGAGWNAPVAMSNFIREVYQYNGGTLALPFHGTGSQVGIELGLIADGLFPN
jgi:hypothetical protein